MDQIVVKFQFEAVHNWPGVTEVEGCEDVEFLKHPHRHMFHVKAIKRVTHDDRDIEIIMLKREMNQWIEESYAKYKGSRNCINIGSTSCEMLAKQFTNEFGLDSCEILEDDENGAIFTKDA